MSLVDTYSGVVLNQNAIATGQYAWRTFGANWIYQTFTLPTDYQRGSAPAELRIPDLSGIQVFVTIDTGYAETASLDYVLNWYGGPNEGWVPLTSGTVIGAHTDGKVWMDIPFTQPIPVTTPMLTAQFRIGLQARTATNAALNQPVENGAGGTFLIGGQAYTANLTPGVPSPITVGGVPALLLLRDTQVTYSIQQGISTIGYVNPTPLLRAGSIQGQAYQTDAITPLLGGGTTSSLNFRVLGLVADSGTNFLNNEYRSCVTSAVGSDTSTTTGLTGPYWMSPPQPSRFSVQSLYFDMRPVAAAPTFGTINYIGNPSFEYDAPGQAPLWWSPFSSGGTVVDQTVQNNPPWVFDGSQALHMQYTFSGTAQQRGILSPFQPLVPLTNGQPTLISVSVAYSVTTTANCSLAFTVLFYDSDHNLLPSPYGTQSVLTGFGTGTLSGTFSTPANAVYAKYMISALSTGVGSFLGYIDAAQVTLTPSAQPFFSGDTPGYQWVAQRGQSASAQQIEPTTDGNAVVVDGIMVDPLTPNMAFNVYHSQDDAHTSNSMTETDWEQKLWTRVPEAYICTQRQTYAFPEPVKTKYLKVEFTNFQAQSYNVGKFQKPVAYKKFPTWVANYFIAQLGQTSFIAPQVGVQYDALGFAYDYYLDDLDQSPARPTAPPQDAIAQLTNYFNPADAEGGVDSTTLAQINLAMQPFRSPLGSNVDPNTSLGQFVSSLLSSTNPPVSVIEGGVVTPIDYTAVSSLRREAIVMEQSLPVMYFFVTCRHTYKELTAPFEYNRAYFAGVKEISFVRDNYTVATDSPLYIESGGDPANIQFTDWAVDTDNNWYAY